MPTAMNLLIFLTHPEPTRSGYEKYLKPRHPELAITTVGAREEALKLAPGADILMCFGPQAKADFFRHTPRLKWVHSLGTGTDTRPSLAKTSSSPPPAASTARRFPRWRS